MLVKKEVVSSLSDTLKFQTITRIWASDGWCYIHKFGERQKFIARSPELFEIVKEHWEGIIPSAENIEVVEYHLLTKKPQAWLEKTEWGCEKFEESMESSSK